MGGAFGKLSTHTPERVVATASGTEAVAMFGKAMLVNWFEHHAHRLLHHTVCHRRDAQRACLLTSGFGYPHPFHCLGLVSATFQTLFHGEQPSFAVFVEVTYRDAVHATSA